MILRWTVGTTGYSSSIRQGGDDPAFIVVDIETGAARRVLEGHRSVVPEKVDLVINGRPIQMKDAQGRWVRPHIGVNPVTEDLQNEWVYFGPMHGTSLYRIKAGALADEKLDANTLGQMVERYSDKPSAMKSASTKTIIFISATSRRTPSASSSRIEATTGSRKARNWRTVNSLAFGPEGKLYAVINQLHRSAVLNGGEALQAALPSDRGQGSRPRPAGSVTDATAGVSSVWQMASI